MYGMGLAKTAVFFKFQFVWSLSFILGGGVIFSFAMGTGQSNYITHNRSYSI
jgi:hypothetical protein